MFLVKVGKVLWNNSEDRFIKLKRCKARPLIQVVTGHAPLNKHMFNLRLQVVWIRGRRGDARAMRVQSSLGQEGCPIYGTPAGG